MRTAAKKPSPKSPPLESASSYVAGTDPFVFAPPEVLHLAGALVGLELERPVYDAHEAEALLAAYLPRLHAIAPVRLEHARVDVFAVTHAMLGVVALTRAPPVERLFERVARAGLFDRANLERLRDVTLLLMHVSLEARAAGARVTKAKVPKALDVSSAEIEKRLQTVCEHFLPDHPLVRHYRPGTGYMDRAYDLFGYADLYVENAAIVAGHVLYRPTDVEDARRVAGELLSALGVSMTKWKPNAVQVDQVQRVWTLLVRLYAEVQSVGLSLFRCVPERERYFPSVFAIGRAGSGRKRKQKSEGK